MAWRGPLELSGWISAVLGCSPGDRMHSPPSALLVLPSYSLGAAFATSAS